MSNDFIDKYFIHTSIWKVIFANIICLLIFALVVFGSIWQGYFNIDPHHWGLMLSNAKDFWEGRLAYQQIFIQYGFLTTAIHAVAYGWFGHNLTSIITITAIAYAIGLLLIYRISLMLTGSLKISIYVLITCYLIHPTVIYPWSNYIAFPFLAYGILMLIKNPQTKEKMFLSGIFFGLAILSREGLAPAIVLLLIFSTLLDIFQLARNKDRIISLFFLLSGLLLPIVLFSIYLTSEGLWLYWYKLSWLLPKVYMTDFFPQINSFSGLGGLIGLFKVIAERSINMDFRWLLLGIMIIANVYIILIMLVRSKRIYITAGVQKIAVATILLLSSSIHLHEVFRLATGSVVGFVTLFILLANYKHISCVFLFIVYTIGLPFYFSIPSIEAIVKANHVKSPLFFDGQIWQDDAKKYYQQIDSDLKHLKNSFCNIGFHYNYTMDAFLQVLSPYEQYQIAPFVTVTSMNNLRSDLDFNKKISLANDIILFQIISENEFVHFKPNNNFVIYNHYPIPSESFMPSKSRLLILIPKVCESLVVH